MRAMVAVDDRLHRATSQMTAELQGRPGELTKPRGAEINRNFQLGFRARQADLEFLHNDHDNLETVVQISRPRCRTAALPLTSPRFGRAVHHSPSSPFRVEGLESSTTLRAARTLNWCCHRCEGSRSRLSGGRYVPCN